MSSSSRSPMPFADAIGVFDSGVGGLSVLRAIRAALPAENLIYVADSGHAPYGDKSESHIIERTLTVSNWLAVSGVKAITVACNTATVVAIRHLREQTHIPVVAIEPAIKPAANTTRSGVVGVLATTQTLQSESVARLCIEHGEGKRILLQACPGWVEAVEQADLHSPQTEALLRQFVVPLMDQGVDTLVLGCTHYPFLRDTLQRIVGDDVVLIDPAVAVATELTRRLGNDRRMDEKHIGTTRFFTTGDVLHVQQVVAHLWGDGALVEAMTQ
ncbi:MAG: glutamate racemase [Betaproteobacteria bacterium]